MTTLEITKLTPDQRTALTALCSNPTWEKLDSETWNIVVKDEDVDEVYEFCETHNLTVRMV